MDQTAVLRQLDLERRKLVRDGELIEILPQLTRLRTIDGSHHTIIHSSLHDDEVEAAISEQVSFYRGLGIEVEWKVYAHDRPSNLVNRLSTHGFRIGPMEAVLVLDLHDRPAWIDESGVGDVFRIDRVEQIDLFRNAAEEIFEKDYGFTSDAITEGIKAGSTQHLGFVAIVEGNAASIGRLYTHPESAFGGLHGGGTRPGYRGRGYYRALIAARAREAARLGARYLIVDALPTSRPILERLGFVHVTDTWPCVLTPKK